MQQELWHDTLYDALGSAVQAAGGFKRVAAKLWPSLDSASAAARLRGCLNEDHAQKLDLHEFDMIVSMATEAADESVMQYLARKHGFEAVRLSPEESKKQARRAKRRWHLDELAKLEDDE